MENSHLCVCKTCNYPFEANGSPDSACPCCQTKNKAKPQDTSKTLSYATTALILYFPANLLPVMTIEMYGQKNTTTIWQGIVSLMDSGDWILALIVFIASMLVPFFKLAVLFYLAISDKEKQTKFKIKLYHFIEIIGPWSMLDVFLVAVLVAIIKFGSMATVTVGEGAVMFLFVVIFTMLSASSFDVKTLWNKK